MSFEAKHYGRCPACDDPIHPGDEVQYDGPDLVHADCSDDDRAIKPSEVACARCFLIHTGDCF